MPVRLVVDDAEARHRSRRLNENDAVEDQVPITKAASERYLASVYSGLDRHRNFSVKYDEMSGLPPCGRSRENPLPLPHASAGLAQVRSYISKPPEEYAFRPHPEPALSYHRPAWCPRCYSSYDSIR